MGGDKNILLWLLFLAVFAAYAIWHIWENKKLAHRLAEGLDGELARWLKRFAWLRSGQILAVLAACLMVIAVYNEQLHHTQDLLKEASQKPPPPLAAVAPSQGFLHDVPAMLAAMHAQIRAAEAAQTPPPLPPADPIEDVYAPEKNGKDNQSRMDDMKTRYEDILVNYLFLKKCGKTTPGDYRIIMSALGQEMASVNAPGRMQYDILTAAHGSYQELYAQSSCQGEAFNTLYMQYTSYIKILSDHFPAQ